MKKDCDNPDVNKAPRVRVLIVDDERILVEVISDMVTSFGFECRGFTSPSDALAELHKRVADYNILICDQSMPLLSGEELINEALKISPSIGVILISGHPEGSPELNTLQRNPQVKILRKPFSMEQLEKTLELIQIGCSPL
jgi:DNA-binding NtrC family response regulator